MELIDRDKLIKELDDMIFMHNADYLQVVATIDAMPTIVTPNEVTKDDGRGHL